MTQQRAGHQLCLSIVSHAQGPLLTRLLDDLATLPGLRGAKTLVTLNVAEAFDPSAWPSLDIEVIRNVRPRGFGANHNTAFALCTSPWFAVLNPDLRIRHDPFPALFAAAEADGSLVAIAPVITDSAGCREDSVRPNLTPVSILARVVLRKRKPLEPEQTARPGSPFFWVAGMFMLLRSSAFVGVGGFDERYFLYCEDYDLCARLYSNGHALKLVAEAQVVHEARRDSHRSARHLRWHLASLARAWCSNAFWRITLGLGAQACR